MEELRGEQREARVFGKERLEQWRCGVVGCGVEAR
jgi:hypothetical protein